MNAGSNLVLAMNSGTSSAEDPFLAVSSKSEKEGLKNENQHEDLVSPVDWSDEVFLSDELKKNKTQRQIDVEDDDLYYHYTKKRELEEDTEQTSSIDSEEIIEEIRKDYEEKIEQIAREKDAHERIALEKRIDFLEKLREKERLLAQEREREIILAQEAERRQYLKKIEDLQKLLNESRRLNG